jgi:RNA polymerase sigma factor (sigma-70 family)
MPPTGTPGDLALSIRRVIAAKARSLIGQYGLQPQDRPDVEQDLAARVVDRLAGHDPSRSTPEGFAARIVDQAVANLLRDRRAKKRTPPKPPTAAPAEEVPDPRADNELRLCDLAEDLKAALADLPDELRALAERLKRETVSQAARAMGVPRSSLYRPVDKLRQVFERAGLRDYL